MGRTTGRATATGSVRRLLVGVTVGLVALLLPAAAAAQTAPYPPGASATCEASVVAPGATITCSAAGFAPNATVTVTVAGNGFTRTLTVSANAQGVATATVTIPETANDGAATITFAGPDAQGNFVRVAAATFTVQEAAAGPAPGVAATGAFVSRGALIALAALVLGGGLVVAARRRDRGRDDLTV